MNFVQRTLGFFGYHTIIEQQITKRYYIAGKDKTGNINLHNHIARMEPSKESIYFLDGTRVSAAIFNKTVSHYEQLSNTKLKIVKKSEDIDYKDSDDEDELENDIDVIKIPPTIHHSKAIERIEHSNYTLRGINLNKLNTIDYSDDEADSDDEKNTDIRDRTQVELITTQQFGTEIDKDKTLELVDKREAKFYQKIKIDTYSSKFTDYRRMAKVMAGIMTISLSVFAFFRFNVADMIKNRYFKA
jgi:hypothetical protein